MLKVEYTGERGPVAVRPTKVAQNHSSLGLCAKIAMQPSLASQKITSSTTFAGWWHHQQTKRGGVYQYHEPANRKLPDTSAYGNGTGRSHAQLPCHKFSSC